MSNQNVGKKLRMWLEWVPNFMGLPQFWQGKFWEPTNQALNSLVYFSGKCETLAYYVYIYLKRTKQTFCSFLAILLLKNWDQWSMKLQCRGGTNSMRIIITKWFEELTEWRRRQTWQQVYRDSNGKENAGKIQLPVLLPTKLPSFLLL
jgi:hypothetical protein